MKTLLGTEGGDERVILCVRGGWLWGFYVAVRVLGRYYRLALGPSVHPWGVYVGRS